ncbi:uncharacterized protein F4817DRAFT_350412 [Daldinia loculata]|uniref:uncharacterized protein n=1 Tax=Daldinia loculata TaxID=103429 RepID=UPI0020C39001|nr:uncharacterized protein F4817DRAFT_350412 [Daldinia loculata]KAI1643222.1 hypothetical protein F4817DRAFT_350412 [Daldinia loculata]
MTTELALEIDTTNFPRIDQSAAKLPTRLIRNAVFEAISDKLQDEVIAVCEELEQQGHCDNKFRAVIYPLPPDTDFDMHFLLLPPSCSNSLTLPEFQLDKDSPKGTPSAFAIVKTKYKDVIPPPLLKSIPTSRSHVVRTLLKKPARNHLRHNPMYAKSRKQFSAQRPLNINAAMLQACGTRKPYNNRCDNCTEGKGFWDSCVVASMGMEYDFGGACANCYYNSRGSSCSFFQRHQLDEPDQSDQLDPSDQPEERRIHAPEYVFTVTLYLVRKLSHTRLTDENSQQLAKPSSLNVPTRSYHIRTELLLGEWTLNITLTADEIFNLARTALQPHLSTISESEPQLPTTEAIFIAALVESKPKATEIFV